MYLVDDKEKQKWYCLRDDQIYYMKEQRWEGRLPTDQAKPVCRKCNKPMKSLDEDRWYCFADDQLYYLKEQRWAEHQDNAQNVTTPRAASRKRPQVITILAYMFVIVGVLGLIDAPAGLVMGIIKLETSVLMGLYGVYGIVLGYGLWYLKRWTLPLLVVVNVIGVIGQFILNIPFDLSNIIPWIVLFYVGKNHELFEKKWVTP